MEDKYGFFPKSKASANLKPLKTGEYGDITKPLY